MKIKRLIIALLVIAVASTCVLSCPAQAYGETAAEIEKKLEDVREAIKETKSEMSEAEEAAAEANVAKLEAEKNLAAATDRLNATKAEIKELNNEIDKQEKALNARLRNMYMNDSVSIVSVLLSSDSISDFLTNMNLVKRIYQNDAEMLEKLEQSKEKVKKEEARLEKEKVELEEKAAEFKAKSDELDAKVASIKDKLDKEKAQEERMQAAAEEISRQTEGQTGGEDQATTGWQWPVPSAHGISSYYGNRISPIYGGYEFHLGIDIPCGYGAVIVAAGSGTVITAGYHYSYGNYVVISHGAGKSTLYAHNSSLLVSAGQHVDKGQQISCAGSTGDSTGNHCHFEIRVYGYPVNPMNYL